MDKSTKFYRVTEAIVKDYDKLKNLKTAEIAKKFDVPSGVVAHIMRTIYITRGVE